MTRIKLVQDTPGSWTHIAVLVDGVKKFHAAKQGTNFWVIVTEDGNHDTIGSGTGRSNVRSSIIEYMAKNETNKD